MSYSSFISAFSSFFILLLRGRHFCVRKIFINFRETEWRLWLGCFVKSWIDYFVLYRFLYFKLLSTSLLNYSFNKLVFFVLLCVSEYLHQHVDNISLLMLMWLFNNLVVVPQVESQWVWVRRLDINLSANRAHFLLPQKLLNFAVNFGSNLHVLVVTIHDDSIDVDKVGVCAILRVPDVVFAVVVETRTVCHTEGNQLITVFYDDVVVPLLEKVIHLLLCN